MIDRAPDDATTWQPRDAESPAQARRAAASFAVARTAGVESAETEGLYRLLVNAVQDYAIFALDSDGYVLSWNIGAERAKGYTADEIIGRHFSVFYPPEKVAEGFPQHELEVAAREGRFEDYGWRLRKDGTLFWANVVITALRDDTGAHVGYAKVTRDLTERRIAEQTLQESEQRFRLLVSAVQDYGIFMLDPTGHVASWNDGAERIKGYTAGEIIGRHFSAFYPDDKVAAGFPAYELEVAARVGRFEDEGWRLRKDGTRFWANVIITALRDETGTLIGFAKVTRDLTERRAAEALRLADAQRVAAAEAANRTKGEFLATMSHELRTPLNAIGGYTQLLELGIRGPVTAEQRADLERIQHAQHHLLGLVDEVLDLAKIDAGRVAVARTEAAAAATVDAALALVRPQAAAKGLALAEACTSAADVRYMGDEPRVRQILVNLLANAVKFTPVGGRVTLTCAVAEAQPVGAPVGAFAGPYVGLRVADTGVGIAPAERERVFEPFTQAHAHLGTGAGARPGGTPYTRAADGTGLGLTISRRLARLMGGDITLEGPPGGGSAFTLWLPAAERRARSRPTPAAGGAAIGIALTGGSAAAPALPPAARGEAEPEPSDAGCVTAGDATERAVLAAVGVALVEGAGALARAWADGLRGDLVLPQATPSGRPVTALELEDHAAALVADVGLTLRVLSEAQSEPTLLRDGAAILGVIAERHGAQRARLGWPAAAVAREYVALAGLLDDTVARAGEIEPGTGGAGVARARTVVADLLAHAEWASQGGRRVAAQGTSSDGA